MFLLAPVCPFHIQCFVSALSLAMKTYCQFVKSNPFCCQWPAFFGYFYETTLASNFLDVTQLKRQDQLELHLFQNSEISFETPSYTYKLVLKTNYFLFCFVNILLRLHPAGLHGVLLHGAFLCIGRTIRVTMYYIKHLTL